MAAIIMPAIPANITPSMRGFVDRYVDAFNATGHDGDALAATRQAAANDVQLYPATTVPNLAAKLLIGLHYLHPDTVDDQLAIDPSDFAMTSAGEILLSALADAGRLATSGGASRQTWQDNLNTYRTSAQRFDAAITALDAVSEGEPGYEDADRQHDDAMHAHVASEHALFATPAPDLTAARVKAEIIHTIHHGSDCMKALVADLVRLEGKAA